MYQMNFTISVHFIETEFEIDEEVEYQDILTCQQTHTQRSG